MERAGRSGKAEGHEPEMYGRGKSDRPVVPGKPPNKAGQPAAEVVEGKGLAKGNADQSATSRTQSRKLGVTSGLERVRQVAKANRKLRFTALLHHVTVDRLRAAFLALKRDAAPGVDGVTWAQYEVGLEPRLEELHSRLH
jgi:hypothetical protein